MAITVTPEQPVSCASSRPAHDDAALLPLLKALADPVRLKIVTHLATTCSTVCACSMPDKFGVSQPTMSHHLKRLVEAGLLDREMRGNWAHFSIRPEGYQALRDFLDWVANANCEGTDHGC